MGRASETLAMSVERVGGGSPCVVEGEAPAQGLGVGPVGGQEPGVALHVGVDRGRAPRRRRWPRWPGPRPRSSARTRGSRSARPSSGAGPAHEAPGRPRPGRCWPPGRPRSRRRGPGRRGAGAGAGGRWPPGPRSWRPAALTPSQGAAEAWASLPGEVDVEVGDGQAGGRPAARRARGGPSSPRGRPSKAPRSSSSTLPPPPSSAGVPSTMTVSPRSSATSARARPAPDGGGGDDVVAAGVADPGQGVVLGADGHHAAGRSRPGPRRRWAGRRSPRSRRSRRRPGRRPRPPADRTSSKQVSGWRVDRSWQRSTRSSSRGVDRRPRPPPWDRRRAWRRPPGGRRYSMTATTSPPPTESPGGHPDLASPCRPSRR